MKKMSGIIESNPGIFGGKPIVKGTRIPVDLVFELFSIKMPFVEIMDDYPSLTREMLNQLLIIANEAKKNLEKIDLNQYIEQSQVNM
jgi:uncharacterized protein (DUF433 family)